MIKYVSIIYFSTVQRNNTLESAACSLFGYKAKIGSMKGQMDMSISSFVETVEICSNMCNMDTSCKSYMHSYARNYCKLLVLSDPSTTETYEDFVFCSKVDAKNASVVEGRSGI